ncbi:phospholipid-transporting ATPase ABCA3-like [Ptychodera flava]|uniref:phospholipid-transporting ATPase ABCA3-like n=1 Tax=Ptychodera flava TaxID=63121 RepID=UPI00396AAF8C
MEFFSQLYLLSWKNFTLRRRHKLRQCVELFWPLIIFLILVWVRGRKPPEHMHECHFNGKAMPSAGLLPFFQSLLCYSQNQCHRYPVTSETSGVVDSFNSSGLAEFYEALQGVVSNQTLMWDLISLWNMTRPLPDNFPLGSILSDPDKLRQVQLSPDVMDAIGNADLTPEKFQEILGDQDWRTALCSDTATLRDLLQIDNDALLREVQHELCDLNMFDMLIVLMRLQGLNNQETYQRILSAINGEADWGDTISTLTDGLPLSDLLSDTDAVREFLEQNISLSENVTDLLLNSPLTPSQLRSLVDQDNLREIVCNTTSLGQYVDMSDPDTLKELSDQLCQLSDKQLEELADELAGHIRNQLNNTDYEKLFNELRTRLELIDSEFQLLEKLSDGLQGFSANQTMESIFLGLCGNQSDAMEGTMMYGLLGGLRGLDIMNITRDYDNSKNNEMPDEYDKYMKREEDEKNEHEYEYDNETTPFCNSMFRSIESNQFTRILWTRLKPLMVGYVPYSPNSKAAKRIIEKASWPFKTLQNIVDLSRDWLEYSPELVEFLNRTELPQLPKSFTDSLKNYSWYEDFVDVYNETLRDKDTWLEAINVLDQLAHTAIDFLQCMNLDRFVGYDTEEEVATQGLKLMQQNKLWAGIVFSNFDQNPKSNVIPKHVHFKIRMDTDVIESTFKLEDRYWTPGPRSNPAFDLKYIQSGFVFLQDMVEHGIIEATANLDKLNTGVYVQQFPYPCYIDDMFIFFLSFVLPMFMVISWVYSVAMTIKSIVYEKERRLKEVMKVMGLGNGVHWVAWFINSFIMMFISSVLLILLIQYGGLLVYSDLSLVLFFMVTFCISTLMLCFLISTFFSRANLAAACGGIIFLATYVPYVLVSAWEDVMSPAQKILAALVNTVAFGFGCTYFAIYEIQGYGLQWDNIATSPTGSNFTFQMSLIMMWVDAGIYALITWYIEAVFPGQYGMPRPWYFPVTKSYWCENARTNTDMTVDNPTYEMGHRATNDEPQQDNDKTSFEAEPSHLPLGVSIRKLVKIYKNGKKLAVDGLSLNFYEDQITSFLGHNGAGKTTTMSILTGLFPPTSGTAYIYGKDIQTDINSIRKSMGMCPQHNVLFDHLTVEEHMWFYARLKGMSNKEVKVEMEQMIKDVGLPNKRHEKTKHLSGGMKRKLSVAIAFAGGSRVVILDEPTAGVDPYARRSIWDLLSKYRKGRTILLTTHHMDEADILGDRIAIMSHGKIKCCGSSLFLKKKYGVGYHMTIVKKRSCDVERISSIVQHHVPDAELENNIGAELSYILPHESSANFEALFTELESQKADVGIASYGASVTTMEEVFLKVGDDSNVSLKTFSGSRKYSSLSKSDVSISEKSSQSLDGVSKAQAVDNSSEYVSMEDEEEGRTTYQHSTDFTDIPIPVCIYNAGPKLYMQQFYAMFTKRVLHTRRNFLIMIAQLLIPLLFTVIAVIVAVTFPGPQPQSRLDLSLELYGRSKVQCSSTTNITDPLCANFVEQYSGSTTTASILPRYDYNGVVEYIVESTTKNLVGFNRENLVTSLFKADREGGVTQAISFFNNQPYHAIASSLNSIDNAILHSKLNDSYNIRTSNYPLPLTVEEQAGDRLTSAATGFSIAFCMVFGMAFLASSFVVFLIKESSTKAKHIQFVSGVHSSNFWLSTLSWDLINYLLPVIVICLLFAIADIKAYAEGGRLGYIFLLLFLYGWAVIPLMYLFSYLFSVPATGFVRMTIFNIVSGLVLFMAIQILSFPTLNLENTAKALTWPFLLSPNFCLGQALAEFYTNYETITLCKSYGIISELICEYEGITYDESYIGWNENGGIGRYLVFLAMEGIVYMALVFLVESKIFRMMWYCIRPRKTPTELIQFGEGVEEDEDVLAERNRLEETGLPNLMATDALILENLRKVYSTFGRKGLVAVDNTSVGVALGECFGLLGNNGAGKTSTFQMLTGDETISGGTAYIDGYDIKTNLKMAQQRLGYCPQFDALIDQMTGRETLIMFARLRGVPEPSICKAADNLIRMLLLEEHADKLVKAYSGGNKRKLSTAIALIGDPPIVFLDEPSTGMDPKARRLLWDAISNVVTDGSRCVVLTSHSMEECEALCTRLAIMVNGQLKCLGSPQHLKFRFGKGYTVLAKVTFTNGEPDLTPIKQFIEGTFPGSKLKDEHQGMVHYHITDTTLTWAEIFGKMERAKTKYNIEDYSVSQTTLEQVFINFARSQRDVAEYATQ